jgi:hypothetical protein
VKSRGGWLYFLPLAFFPFFGEDVFAVFGFAAGFLGAAFFTGFFPLAEAVLLLPLTDALAAADL